MKPIWFVVGVIFLGGCSKSQIEEKSKTADNSMTRTAEALHDDVNRARSVVEKANQANETTQKEMQQNPEGGR